MQIVPKRMKHRDGFRGSFQHPISKIKTTFTLGPDIVEAENICREISAICSDPALLADGQSPRLFGYHPRAVQIIFGRTVPAAAGQLQTPAMVDEDIGQLAMRIAIRVQRVDQVETIRGVLERYTSDRYTKLSEQYRTLETQMKNFKARATEAEYELAKSRREKNTGIHIQIGHAAAEWNEIYPRGRAHSTATAAAKALRLFIASLPQQARFPLSEVTNSHIDTWLDNQKSAPVQRKRRKNKPAAPPKDPTELSPITKKNMRAYLSVFFGWAKRKYKLFANPVAESAPVPGASKNPEHIVAIRRLDEINTLLDGLKEIPYWQAVVATAILAGPRYSELVWLKLDDVYLSEAQIYIASRTSGPKIVGTKTGRERRIPIERTRLLPILKAHVARRRAEQAGPRDVDKHSPWLFPSIVDAPPLFDRVVAQPGMWSHNSVFTTYWARAAKDLKIPTIGAFWSYGPSEWRHTFGTVLGHCGWSSLEISNVMGNSESIARRFYIVPGHGGKRWPFKF